MVSIHLHCDISYRYQNQNDSIVAAHEQVQSISNMASYSYDLYNMLQQ